MFSEPHYDGLHGWIEVITGSMFSGKTEELLRRLRRAELAHLSIRLFKPLIDTRYSMESVVSHDNTRLPCVRIVNPESILADTQNVDVVAIDEAQFFSEALVNVCTALADAGKRVIVSGLDMDYRGLPFGVMPHIIARAEFVTKVHAICVQCGSLANYSHRISSDNNLILIGEKDRYEPLCRKCFCQVCQQQEHSTSTQNIFSKQ